MRLIELANQDLRSEIDQLVQCTLPKTIQKGLVLELGITLRENGLKCKELANFLLIMDRWYGHLHPGGLEQYEACQDSRLRIGHITQDPWGLIISKNISKASDAQAMLILWLLLKHLQRLKSFQINGPKGSEEILLELENPLLIKKNTKLIEHSLSNDECLRSFSSEGIKKLSYFFCTLYHREYRCLNTAIHFSKKGIINIVLKIQEPIGKKPIEKDRIFAEEIILTSLLQEEDEYKTQLIEYAKNGNGMSLFMSEASKSEEKRLRNKTNNIVVLIGQKKLRGLLMHITQKGEGLLLGIQLRYPIQNWNTLFKEALN